MKPKTEHSGAQIERDAFRDNQRRELTTQSVQLNRIADAIVQMQRSITRMKKFSAQRVKRYRARQGGL